MVAVRLELRCPQNVDGIAVDPEPNWNFDNLLSEINTLEKKLNASSKFPLPFIKTRSLDTSHGESTVRNSRAFVMRISDDEMENMEDESEECNKSSVVAKRFNYNEIYLSSEDSDDESASEAQSYLMDKVGLVEGALHELTHEHQLAVKEEIRNHILAFETDLMSEIETYTSALARVEKHREARREKDRKLDLQYQRKVAEALDNHLTAVQRDHELKSQIEERKIRSDAAYEEVKRKEKALQEEKLRQEKAKAEAEVQAKLRAEEAKRVALEAERRAAKEAAEREAANASQKVAAGASQGGTVGFQKNVTPEIVNLQSKGSGSDGPKISQSLGKMLRAAESALNLEQQRLLKLKELDETNRSLRSSSHEDFSSYERHIARLIRQIRGTKENVSAKASEIIKIFNNARCPQSISIAAFAKKVVSHCESPDNAPFACSYVIVLVTSQFPHATDFILAELYRACIYTVPKHMVYLESAFGSKEAYYKAIGYHEDDGKIESIKDCLKRVESYMKLYGALVQTEIHGVRNTHGLEEGWAWLARFLNTVPANIYTAVALNSFLQMAGFALYRKYRSQFKKILNIISENFLTALRARGDPELNPIIAEIHAYLEDNKFLQEPEGRSLQNYLLSSVMVPSESDY